MSPLTVASQEISSIKIPLPADDLYRRRNTTINCDGEANKKPSTPPPPPPVVATWTYQGYSRAGTATSFVLVEPKWVFDCGCIIPTNSSNHKNSSSSSSSSSIQRPTCIFLTHTHADHIQSLHQIVFSQKPINATTTTTTTSTNAAINANTIHIYFPAVSESLVRNFLQSYYEMIRDTDDDENDDDNNGHVNSTTNTNTTVMELSYNFRLHPIQVNDEFTVPSAVKHSSDSGVEYIVRIVECCHRKVCVGYSIFQRQQVYKEPYRSMSGIEFGQYMKANHNKNNTLSSSGSVATTTTTSIKEWSPNVQPILCFLGDTTTRVFTLHPEILQQHTMIAIECTYYDGTIEDETTNVNQHTYWEVLRTKILQQYPNTLFLLQHFSNRHRTHEWAQWMYEYNQTSQHYNVHPMLLSSRQQSSSTSSTTDNDCQATITNVSNIVTMNELSIHNESSSNSAGGSHLGTISCNCVICQPSLKSKTDCVS